MRGRNFDAFYYIEITVYINYLYVHVLPITNGPLVIPTWYPLLGFTWNFFPGEARCGVFLRNWVTYRDHLPLDIFGGWHLWTSPHALVTDQI